MNAGMNKHMNNGAVPNYSTQQVMNTPNALEPALGGGGAPAAGGSGPSLDAQGLVGADILGLFDLFQPKFSKRYSEIGLEIKNAFRRYHDEVISQKFPYTDNQYNVPEIVMKNFLSWIKNN